MKSGKKNLEIHENERIMMNFWKQKSQISREKMNENKKRKKREGENNEKDPTLREKEEGMNLWLREKGEKKKRGDEEEKKGEVYFGKTYEERRQKKKIRILLIEEK